MKEYRSVFKRHSSNLAKVLWHTAVSQVKRKTKVFRMYKDIGRERHYVVDVKIFREEKVVGTSFGHKSITSCFWKKKSLLQKTGGALARARSSTRHTTKKKLVPPFCKASGLLLCSFKTLGTCGFILSTFIGLCTDMGFKFQSNYVLVITY